MGLYALNVIPSSIHMSMEVSPNVNYVILNVRHVQLHLLPVQHAILSAIIVNCLDLHVYVRLVLYRLVVVFHVHLVKTLTMVVLPVQTKHIVIVVNQDII